MSTKEVVLIHIEASGPVSFESCEKYVARQTTEEHSDIATGLAITDLIREGKVELYEIDGTYCTEGQGVSSRRMRGLTFPGMSAKDIYKAALIGDGISVKESDFFGEMSREEQSAHLRRIAGRMIDAAIAIDTRS